MEDQKIIKLFNERSEKAIKVVEEKYGLLCKKVAERVVNNEQDALECVNDMLFAVWNKIPPENPDPLVAYVCRVTKNIALKRYEYLSADKRNSSYEIAIDELENFLKGNEQIEDEILTKELQEEINIFLEKQKKLDRIFFVRRYWFAESIYEIAASYGKSNNYVTVHLHRMRENLKRYLMKEGLIQ